MKSQMEHEPSRSYSEEIYNEVKEIKPKKALEIGAAWGLSTLSILLASEECHLTSVDKDSTAKAPSEVKINGLEKRFHFINRDSTSYWKKFPDERFDFIYIDGSHIYEDVLNDAFEAWDRLKEGGTLMFDDIVHKANKTGEYGISMATWQLIVKKNIRQIKTTTRLLLIKK